MGLYSVLRQGNSLRVGATSVKTNKLSQSDLAHGRGALLEKLEQLGRRPTQLFDIQDLWGIRTLCKDRLPVWGRLSLAQGGPKNISVLGGLYKSGWQLAPALAASLCEEILTHGIQPEHAAFHARRFAL